MTDPERPASLPEEPPPPILGSWRRLYAAVLATLVLLIVLFYLFGKAFQ